MIRIEVLLLKWLSNFGSVDPIAGDLGGEVLEGEAPKSEAPTSDAPESESRESSQEPAVPYLGSPYECAPTTWGLVETPGPQPAPQPKPTPPRRAYRPGPLPKWPESKSPNESRRRFRLNIPSNRQPPPRGLLSS